MQQNTCAKFLRVTLAFILFTFVGAACASNAEIEASSPSRYSRMAQAARDYKGPVLVGGLALLAGATYAFTDTSAQAVTPLLGRAIDDVLNVTQGPRYPFFYVNASTLHTIVVTAPSLAVGWVSVMLAWVPECYNSEIYTTQRRVEACLEGCLQPLATRGATGLDCLYLVQCHSNGTQTLTCDELYGGWRATNNTLYQPPVTGYPTWFNETNMALDRLQYQHPDLSFHWDWKKKFYRTIVNWSNGLRFWGA